MLQQKVYVLVVEKGCALIALVTPRMGRFAVLTHAKVVLKTQR
jgi:hypothetical protein